MIEDYTADIERYTHYLEKEIVRANKIAIEGEQSSATLHKKLVFAAIFDSLSKCIFPKKGNRDRIISFLIEFSEWEDHDRISLPHLCRLLEKNPEPVFSKLRTYTNTKLRDWEDGELIELSREPKISEIKSYWPNEKDYKKPLNGVTIESLQHSNLFYYYRNALVHEFRHPGYGMEDRQDEHPFYISFTHHDGQDERDSWELVYPVGFFNKLIATSFTNMKKYLLKNNINPYFSYTFGSYWVDELNK